MVRLEDVGDGYRLQQAWLELRGGRTLAARQQGAGVDGVTLADWEADSQWHLENLRADLLGGTYRPSPLLWFDLPRRSHPEPSGRAAGAGQHGGRRRLGIPTVTDRVVQRAVKNLLDPIWEQSFLSCSHGFRPDRSVFTAVAHVLWHAAHGLGWVADADIEACFDRLAHDRLLSQVAPTVDDGVLGLIAAWLKAGAAAPGLGVAQGAVISPLLANIYLHPFDEALVGAGLALVRYADDWVVMCSSQDEALEALDLAAGVLARLDLALNQAKTGVVPFGPGFRFLGAEFSD
jgi:group II intron reverse transcriptase/maturase